MLLVIGSFNVFWNMGFGYKVKLFLIFFFLILFSYVDFIVYGKVKIFVVFII